MNLSRELQQRRQFCDILFELAKSQEILEDSYYRSNIYKCLEGIYDVSSSEKSFRHFYTDIFSVLTQIQQNSNLGDINILGQNLEVIRNKYNPNNKSNDGIKITDISDSIKKLYDHVNLDIARISYSDAADRIISGESSVENLQCQINLLQHELKKAQNINEEYDKTERKILEVEEKLDNSPKEYITILGIFAAVVLAFTGGIAFSTSVLNNIAQASVYRIIVISLIIGLVLINIFFALFSYVNKLVNKSNSIFPLIFSNVIFIILIVATVLAWNFGWVENRDIRINNKQNSIVDCIEGYMVN